MRPLAYNQKMRIRQCFERPLSPGDRVLILPDPVFVGPWPNECLATVISVARARNLTPQASRRNKFVYMVRFDEPQLDGDGDGPYTSTEVLSQYVARAGE